MKTTDFSFLSKMLLSFLLFPLMSCAGFQMSSSHEDRPTYLYKVLSRSDWAASQNREDVKLAATDEEFIHLSTKEQLAHILNKYWPEDPTAVILKVDVRKLKGRLVKERNPGGTSEYYHLYEGAISLDAVVAIFDRLTMPP